MWARPGLDACGNPSDKMLSMRPRSGYTRSSRRRKRGSRPWCGGARLLGDVTRADLERGEQACGAVPFVVVRVALDLPGLHRQHRLGPVERLNLGLLVDRQDDRPLGRREVEPDHVADLRLELGIGAPLERLGPVGLEAGLQPDPLI